MGCQTPLNISILMELDFTTVSIMTLDHDFDTQTSKLVSTKFQLSVPSTIDQKQYEDQNGQPNKAGAKMISNCLIQALSGNIHTAHQGRHWDSAEHFRWVISELERSFIEPSKCELVNS